jgi:hypothetical protein
MRDRSSKHQLDRIHDKSDIYPFGSLFSSENTGCGGQSTR